MEVLKWKRIARANSISGYVQGTRKAEPEYRLRCAFSNHPDDRCWYVSIFRGKGHRAKSYALTFTPDEGHSTVEAAINWCDAQAADRTLEDIWEEARDDFLEQAEASRAARLQQGA